MSVEERLRGLEQHKESLSHGMTVYPNAVRFNVPVDLHPAWTFLAAPLTSTSWDGDSYSTTAKTLIDLSAVFGVPAGVKAVLIRVAVQDSDAASGDYYIVLSPNNSSGSGLTVNCIPVNDRLNRTSIVVPCDANGDIYYQIVASGANTFDVHLQIWGYYL